MTVLTTIRMATPTAMTHAETAAAVDRFADVPRMPHRGFDLSRHGEPAALTDVLWFDHLVPNEPLPNPSWTLDDGVFTLAMSFMTFHKADGPGLPTRRGIVLDALSAITSAEDGRIVGGWMSDHSTTVNPIIALGGRILLAFSHGTPWEKPWREPVRINPRIPTGLLTLDDERRVGVHVDAIALERSLLEEGTS